MEGERGWLAGGEGDLFGVKVLDGSGLGGRALRGIEQ
jgi:hypothetical protein